MSLRPHHIHHEPHAVQPAEVLDTFQKTLRPRVGSLGAVELDARRFAGVLRIVLRQVSVQDVDHVAVQLLVVLLQLLRRLATPHFPFALSQRSRRTQCVAW